MTLSAHQPCYLPWLGYFHKLAHCDLFVVLDDVPLSGVDKDNWVNRVWISGPPGDTLLTVPLRRKGHAGAALRDVPVDGTRWIAKHRRSLEQTYAHAPSHDYLVVSELANSWRTPADFAWAVNTLAGKMGTLRPMRLQSRAGAVGHGEDMLLDLCRHFNADRFLFGRNGRDYVTMDKWRAAGIEPVFQDFTVPEYPRRGPPTMRILSAVDAIANIGLDQTREIVMGGKV